MADVMHSNWLANLVEKRNIWLGLASGRRIVEEIDRVQLFERERLLVEVLVQNGNIENAKAEALTYAIERDRREGQRA
jgi:hypothetical protein